MKPQFYAKNHAVWRRWLEQNHAGASEVWLVFYKKHTGKPCASYNDAVEEALCFGWIDGIKRRIDDERYAFRFTPRNPNSNWSPSNIKRVTNLIAEGRMTAAGMRLVEAAKASGAWAAALKPRVFEMPAELKEALAANKEAGAFFESLPPSQKKQFIGWIASAKRPETRQKRLQKAMALLAEGKRLGMV